MFANSRCVETAVCDALEGFTLGRNYLSSLQQKYAGNCRAFCGDGAATLDLEHPPVEWRGGDTYIQKEGINHDFGRFDDPDAFYAAHGVNVRGLRKWLFKHFVRQWMNANVARVRNGFL